MTRTLLIPAAAALLALAPATAAAGSKTCKPLNPGNENNITVSGKGVSCGTASYVVDLFWHAGLMAEAMKAGTLLSVTDPETGITAESYSARGWKCVRAVKRITEDNSTRESGTAKCTRRGGTVRWTIVDPALPNEPVDN